MGISCQVFVMCGVVLSYKEANEIFEQNDYRDFIGEGDNAMVLVFDSQDKKYGFLGRVLWNWDELNPDTQPALSMNHSQLMVQSAKMALPIISALQKFGVNHKDKQVKVHTFAHYS